MMSRPETFEDAVLLAERADASLMWQRGSKPPQQHYQTRVHHHQQHRPTYNRHQAPVGWKNVS